MVRPYEIMLVLQPGLEEEGVDALLERLMGVVTGEGGTIDNVDRWGKDGRLTSFRGSRRLLCGD